MYCFCVFIYGIKRYRTSLLLSRVIRHWIGWLRKDFDLISSSLDQTDYCKP